MSTRRTMPCEAPLFGGACAKAAHAARRLGRHLCLSAPIRVLRARARQLEIWWLRRQLARLDRHEQIYLSHIKTELDYSESLRLELMQLSSELAGKRSQVRARLRQIWRV